MRMRYKPFILMAFTSLSILSYSSQAVESQLWRDYANGDRARLPDFSYAGYDRGETSIPDVNWNVYNVVECGADPNPDTQGSQDLDAIKKARIEKNTIVILREPQANEDRVDPGVRRTEKAELG